MGKTGRVRARDKLDKNRSEVPDGVPMAPPLGYVKQESLHDKIRAMVRSEHLRLAALRAGAETFEEADDFEVGDDFDPASPYEEVFDPLDHEVRAKLREDEFRQKFEARMSELRPAAGAAEEDKKEPAQQAPPSSASRLKSAPKAKGTSQEYDGDKD